MAISVRRAGPRDEAVLVEFNAGLARETEGVELDLVRLGRGVRRLLDDPARGHYRVAEEGGQVLGALAVTREWSDWRDGWFWWIQSVYVRAAARGRGVYAALHRDVEREARADPEVCGLRLYVEPENARAQAVYGALGMCRAPYVMFETDFVVARGDAQAGGSGAASEGSDPSVHGDGTP